MRLPPRLRLRSTPLEPSALPSAPAPASPTSLKRRLSSSRPQLGRVWGWVGNAEGEGEREGERGGEGG